MAIQKITTGIITDNAIDGTKIALGSDAVGDIMYYNGTDYVSLPKGTAGQVLTMNTGATAPQWGTGSGGGSPSPPAGHSCGSYETGDRTSTISVSSSGLSFSEGSAGSQLVDGLNADANQVGSRFVFGAHTPSAGAYIRFTHTVARTFNEVKWYGCTNANGVWKWQGSNDGSTFTDIGSSFTLQSDSGWGGTVATTFQTQSLGANTTAYTIYQLTWVSGQLQGGDYQAEVEFKTVGNPSYTPGGTVASYQWSGQTGGQFTIDDSIERIPYATENGTATGASTLFAGKFWGGGADDASGANGYMMFGMTKESYDMGSSQIQKYAHASSTDAVQTGNINTPRSGPGNYHQDEINMFLSSGYAFSANTISPIVSSDNIEKVSFASPSSATIVGSIDIFSKSGAGTSSSTHGYCAGGNRMPTDPTGPGLGSGSDQSVTIKRFAFATNVDAVVMTGVLTPVSLAGYNGAWSDSCYGWRAENHSPLAGGISKYAFFSDTDSVQVVDLAFDGYASGYGQSQTKGYTFGAHFNSSNTAGSKVSAFTFATESDQAFVGNLQINRYGAGVSNGSA